MQPRTEYARSPLIARGDSWRHKPSILPPLMSYWKILSFDYLVDIQQLNDVILYIPDNSGDIPMLQRICEANEPFMLVRSPMLLLTFSLRGV